MRKSQPREMIPWRLVQTTLFCHNASRCGGCAGDDRIQSPREGRGGWLARGVAVRIQEWREQRLRRHRPVCRHRRHQPAEQLPRLAVEREGALPRVGQRVCGGGVDAPRGEVVPGEGRLRAGSRTAPGRRLAGTGSCRLSRSESRSAYRPSSVRAGKASLRTREASGADHLLLVG